MSFEIYGHRDAHISECERYRWLLWRLQPGLFVGAPLGCIGLNPSTADAEDDDPTVRRWLGFAAREGHGGIIVGNLYAWRATDPKELTAVKWWPEGDPVGPKNDEAIDRVAEECRVILVSWGGLPRPWMKRRAADVIDRLRAHGNDLVCLGMTKTGQPKHPLYLAGDTPMVRL